MASEGTHSHNREGALWIIMDSYGGFKDVLRWFNHRKMRSQQSRIGGVIMGPNNNQYCTSLRPDPHDDDVSN
jgi:hypothetical protein